MDRVRRGGLWEEESFEGGHDGAGCERDFGKGNDADEDGHKVCEEGWIAGRAQKVGSDFRRNSIAEHEHACGGGGGVEEILCIVSNKTRTVRRLRERVIKVKGRKWMKKREKDKQ